MVVGSGALSGLGILVTRPEHQAGSLCKLIEEQGGSAHRFPAMEIQDPEDRQPLEQIAARLEQYEWAIFISVNAVQRALTTILRKRAWPTGVRIAVIGRRSAEELQAFGLCADLCPEDKFDSEALLALAPMQAVSGQSVVIFRGDGGREFLADTLRARGATVDYVEAYRRGRPQVDVAPLLKLWRAGDIDVVVVNSAESLHNLKGMLTDQGAALLRRAQLLVVSERMLDEVKALGIEPAPILAANATDTAVVQALLDWRAQRNR